MNEISAKEVIANLVRQCNQLSQNMCVLTAANLCNDETEHMLARSIRRNLRRFVIWCKDHNAHLSWDSRDSRGKRSLDYQLQNSSHLSDLALRLIRELIETLRDLVETLNGEPPPTEELGKGRNSDAEKPAGIEDRGSDETLFMWTDKITGGHTDDDADKLALNELADKFEDEVAPTNERTAELVDEVEEIAHIVECLENLEPAIQYPSKPPPD
ncbi:hypothetical protein F5Y16DRAFT_268885 [Xylariaceae sp. FL0255]|nr:hypothetical protein F5Y16DRAFT_268885 [Xylariaceae sp. FL0255]